MPSWHGVELNDGHASGSSASAMAGMGLPSSSSDTWAVAVGAAAAAGVLAWERRVPAAVARLR